MEKKKIMILYHSGAGSTKTIAEIYNQLLNQHTVQMASVTESIPMDSLDNSDLLIFAFPTYHCTPSTSMRKFVQRIPVLKAKAKAFIITTYGLFSGNAIRIFSQEAKKKNIITVGYSDYKAPATDGTLLFPPFSFMYRYENKIEYAIRNDVEKIIALLDSPFPEEDIPAFKLYTILNAPNKYLGEKYQPVIKIIEDRCIQCNMCINNCPNNCWAPGQNKYPLFNRSDCESCYRCIHHCPEDALIISSRTVTKKKLNHKFYRELKDGILNKILS